jgi:dTDP-4-dehydrorhamnose 3,5-epimerase
MGFRFIELEIPDVIIVQPDKFSDQRGFFSELYKSTEFKKHGINTKFVQENLSYSKKGVLRGLHYQTKPKEQGKFVRVLSGRIFDVVVDIRQESKTFKKWLSVELSEDNDDMLWIPPGFAHGFLALEDDTKIVYKVTSEYSPKNDSGIRWNDPDLKIKWPIANPTLSNKDSALPMFKDAKI